MNKTITDNSNLPVDDSSDSSAYLQTDETAAALDFGSLFSDRFVNITPLHNSKASPTELFSATRFGKRFVLKGLKEQHRADPIQNMALAKEFEIGMFLDHPNIRRTIGLESVDGLGKAIILEYVDGSTLEELLATGCITKANARTIAAQIADALAYMHSKQVLHRDLKPSNIIVSHQGDIAKLIDFNLSDSQAFVILKNPAGTRNYVDPEQLKPNARPSVLADIYSFGVVIDELAEAAGDSLLRDMALKCMNPNPAKRPQSFSAVKLPSVNPSTKETMSAMLSSKTLTYILLCACAALAAEIIYLLLSVYK